MWMKVMGLFAAPVLSVFVLGILTRRAHFVGWLAGAASGIALTAILQWQASDRLMAIWHFPISFVVTTTVGYVASLLIRPPQPQDA
jgi:Na+/proline symporter